MFIGDRLTMTLPGHIVSDITRTASIKTKDNTFMLMTCYNGIQ